MKYLLLALFLLPLQAAPPARVSIEQRLDQLRKSPPELYAFLLRMPKGGDLHNHLAGAAYAENIIKSGAESGLCVNRQTLAIVPPSSAGPCAADQMPAAMANKNNRMFNALIDAFSMRDFVPGRESAHDHFFNSFGLFDAAADPHSADFVAELAGRAAEQNESYLELMTLAGAGPVSELGAKVGFNGNFAGTAASLRAAGLPELVAGLKREMDGIENGRRSLLHCDSEPNSAACAVTVRYVYQVLREFPKDQVFAQTLAGFGLAASDPRVVAVNFVQPEDGINSMRDYHLHMQMIDFAKHLYPKVHISLHAGELAPGLVPPEGLRFHIREAIDLGHAERIGHGVSVMYETDAVGLLSQMKNQHIAVEINLTSNDLILGVKGGDHPFPVYRKYGVPVAICTDDEGVNRSHLTMEYQRAVLTYGLTYADLKEMVRNSLEYSFLSGASFWTGATYGTVVKPCAGGTGGQACVAFIAGSDKARAQADLEKRFREFEKQIF